MWHLDLLPYFPVIANDVLAHNGEIYIVALSFVGEFR